MKRTQTTRKSHTSRIQLLPPIVSEQRLMNVQKEKITLELMSKIPELVQKGVQEELAKAQATSIKEAHQYRYPERINSNSDPERKPGSDVPFSYMRRMAQIYPIARACINRRIRQITQLEWDLTTIDEVQGEEGYADQIAQVKAFFREPMGHKTRMRELLTTMIDDLLTIDAVCFEVQKTRGGQFLRLVPVDPTTILLKVTETGATPEPPDTAYVQVIQGRKMGEFTTDDLIYDKMGNRSYTPYGVAPLESLILQAEAAIRGTLYNLNYFRENNVPEGFLALPEDVAQTKELVEQWQLWFDAIVAGDARFTHRLKVIPGGAVYTPAKKPEDMAFERFELWLLQQTCAVFDVPPQEIGITYQVNKSTGKQQSQSGDERGLIPLGNFIREIFNDLVQNWMGFTNLQFIWRDINPVDRQQEIDIAEKEIHLGALSVDEYRVEHGREAIGLDNYIMTGSGPIKVDDFVAGKTPDQQDGSQKDKEKKDNQDLSNENGQQEDDQEQTQLNDQQDDDAKKMVELETTEIRQWRDCIVKDFRRHRPLREKFKAHYINKDTYALIKEAIPKIKDAHQAKVFFDQFLDPEIKASFTLLDYAQKLEELDHATPLAN